MTHRLENIVNTLIDVRNGRSYDLVQIVPFKTIRKSLLNDDSTKNYGDILRHIRHMKPEEASKYLTKELADKLAREKHLDCYCALDRGVAKQMNTLQYMEKDLADFTKAFMLYYGPFFGKPEHDIPEIAKRLSITQKAVRYHLDTMDADFFSITQEAIDKKDTRYSRRHTDIRAA